MGFLAGLASYLVRFVVFSGVAFLGIVIGKKLRISKDKKDEKTV